MLATIRNTHTNEELKVDFSEQDLKMLREELAPVESESSLLQRIENLDIAAEAKLLLQKMALTTIQIGNTILSIGAKVLEIVFWMVIQFPNTATGLIIGAILQMLISSIPIVGWLFGWILVPLCTAIGFAIDMIAQINTKAVRNAAMKGASLLSGLQEIKGVK